MMKNMLLKSDEELFSQIPQKDGTVLVGNRAKRDDDPEDATLLGAYLRGLGSAEATMKGEHVEVKRTFYSWDDYMLAEPYDFSHQKDVYIDKFRRHAHKYIDASMEQHLDRTNGLIGAFPPFSHIVGKVGDKEVRYSHINAKDTCRTCPEYVSDLSRVYKNLYPDNRTNNKKYRGYTVAAAVMMLVYILAVILLQPVISNLSVAVLGNIGLVMSIAGILIPYKGLQYGKELLHFPNGVIAFFALIVINVVGLLNLADENWSENLLAVLTWAIPVYAVVVFLLFVIQLVKTETAQKKFRKTQKDQLEEQFTKLMDKYAQKLHRYIRLHVLWCRYEGESCPGWLNELEQKLELYVREYETINGEK